MRNTRVMEFSGDERSYLAYGHRIILVNHEQPEDKAPPGPSPITEYGA